MAIRARKYGGERECLEVLRAGHSGPAGGRGSRSAAGPRRRGRRAIPGIQVDPEAIRVVTRTAARLSIYRPEDGAMLAWSIRAGE
jgi:hypothetical protein